VLQAPAPALSGKCGRRHVEGRGRRIIIIIVVIIAIVFYSRKNKSMQDTEVAF